jgi:hypothetical protein
MKANVYFLWAIVVCLFIVIVFGFMKYDKQIEGMQTAATYNNSRIKCLEDNQESEWLARRHKAIQKIKGVKIEGGYIAWIEKIPNERLSK